MTQYRYIHNFAGHLDIAKLKFSKFNEAELLRGFQQHQRPARHAEFPACVCLHLPKVISSASQQIKKPRPG
jgi:hypothetical protein